MAGATTPSRPGSARLWRTATFRFALLYALVFALSAVLLLALTYRIGIEVIDRETEAAINGEIDSLNEHYQRQGLTRLADIIAERSGPQGDRLNVYLLADAAFNPLVGNLAAWPKAEMRNDWLEFQVDDAVAGGFEVRDVRARQFRLRGGYRLLVGRETVERARFARITQRTLIWSGGAILALGLIVGLLFSRGLLRRVDDIARASADIVAGDLSRRMPLSGSGDEFDHLGEQLNAMLQHIEALMTSMRVVTDSLAHDLRSPLTRLRSRLEQLQTEAVDPAGRRESLTAAIADVDSVLRTFNALLRIAEAEAQSGRAPLAPVALDQVVTQIVDLYQPLAEERGLQLTTELAANSEVAGHADLLAQAIANLVDNAIKYTPTDGRILVALRRNSNVVELSVSDTGPGVPADQRDHVLKRFVRLDPSRHAEGSGLGLSLVAAVARLHGATLTLADNRPGLRVVLAFPAAGAIVPSSTAPAPKGHSAHQS
ncbi:MAG: HAMP domain-containing histidine kinase [Alphaproteobacteria bacterium]|nr:HAMP domain-containing histidine kinase [Alphaproteobacteria bacterium]